MSRSLRFLLAFVAMSVVLGFSPGLVAQSKAERDRQRLLDKLGIDKSKRPKKKKSKPPAENAPVPDDQGNDDQGNNDEQTPPEQSPGEEKDRAPKKGKRKSRPTVSFASVQTLLVNDCVKCHKRRKKAGQLLLTKSASANREAIRRFVDPRRPDRSLLLRSAAGLDHKKTIWPTGSVPYKTVRSYIAQGVRPSLARNDADAHSQRPPPKASKPRVRRDTSRLVAKAPATSPSKTAPKETAAAHEDSAAQSPTPLAPAPSTPRPAQLQVRVFTDGIHDLLRRQCADCHDAESSTQYIAHADVDAHYASAKAFVDITAEQSLLFQRAVGIDHAGDEIFSRDSTAARLLKEWIDDGAHASQPASVAAAGTEEPDARPTPAATDVPRTDEEPGVSSQEVSAQIAEAIRFTSEGLKTALDGFQLHGRFDLSLERRDYTNNPFSTDARNALRSYHHFLFLSRHTDKDPFGFDAELVTLQFWNVSFRVPLPKGPWKLHAKAGKLIVPFGAEPTYHHAYGGLAAFDQKLLPAIWSVEGVALSGFARLWKFGLIADLYAVRGFSLRDEDAVINLQSDIAPLDKVSVQGGGRLGVSLGPVAAWYSANFGFVGFGRRLLMQAFDIGLARWRGVPVLENISLAAGFFRADLSGGGPGEDHYHFGSYWQARYHLGDWIDFQYRQGLRTFDNRGGLIVDSRRLSSADASTHSLAAVMQLHGVTVGFWHFWNLEKVDEIDDDFFRFTVAYAF